MANYFLLTLDTLAPQGVTLSINSGASKTPDQSVALTIGTSDSVTTGYKMMIWGGVNTANDVSVQTSAGVYQVETATVVVGTVAAAGDVVVTVTGVNIGNSPKEVNVTVATGDSTYMVASKIATALALQSDITTNYVVNCVGELVSLTSKLPVADDTTINIAIDGTTNSTDVTDAATSANTATGVAGSRWVDFDTTYNIELLTGDGSKTIYVKVRDDVGNVSSSANASITLDTTSPVVTVTLGPTPSKISKVTGWNLARITFESDEPFVEYKVCYVDNLGDMYGALTNVTIGTTYGSLNISEAGASLTESGGSWLADNGYKIVISGADLEAANSGDGEKTIKIFVKDNVGNWSI